jgi:hypothetical protein
MSRFEAENLKGSTPMKMLMIDGSAGTVVQHGGRNQLGMSATSKRIMHGGP